jgi:hypothetical protein
MAFSFNEDDPSLLLQFRISLTILGLSNTNFVYKASFSELFVTEAASTEEFFISKYFKRNYKVQ